MKHLTCLAVLRRWLLPATLCLSGASAWAVIPIQHWTHPSGARVYLVASPTIPMLDVQVDLDGGSRRDPADRAGLASATASMLSSGVFAQAGQPALDENALSGAWVDLGAQLGVSAGSERLSISLRTLTEPDLLERSVTLAVHQLAAPAWVDTVWVRDRQRWLASIKEAETRPGT
jgi:zinc protease